MSFQPLSNRFSDALVLAADLHRHQARKETDIPYVSHLLAVSSIALEFGANEDEAIAALLHDAIEDAPTRLGADPATAVRQRIALAFGSQVLDIVEACTDTDAQQKPPWIARKTQYVDAIAHKPAPAMLVAASDKLHNARAILRDFRTKGELLWPRFDKDAGKKGVIGYYRGLVSALQARAKSLDDPRLSPLIQELAEVVATLEHEAEFKGVWPPE